MHLNSPPPSKTPLLFLLLLLFALSSADPFSSSGLESKRMLTLSRMKRHQGLFPIDEARIRGKILLGQLRKDSGLPYIMAQGDDRSPSRFELASLWHQGNSVLPLRQLRSNDDDEEEEEVAAKKRAEQYRRQGRDWMTRLG